MAVLSLYMFPVSKAWHPEEAANSTVLIDVCNVEFD